jgi:hypothetical protein
MISDETLARAAEQGLISAAQAEGLRALEAATIRPPDMDAWSAAARPSPDDESLRFITGFSDVFVAIGLFLFLGAAGFFLQKFFGNVAQWIGLATLAWLLAEFFARKRRMALPSIILLGFFVVSVFSAVAEIAGSRWDHSLLISSLWFNHLLRGDEPTPLWIAGLATTIFAGFHYWRFRIPVTVAAAAAALSTAFIGLVLSVWQNPDRWTFDSLLLLCGIATFVLAMYFDSSDPQRATRRTDIAFWLHLLAAPLIVHPVIALFAKGTVAIETSGAVTVLAIFLVFALVAVAIDRRALLVSGLIYAGIAFGTLLRQTGFTNLMLPATLLALGAFVLVLSAGWQPLRRTIWHLFPAPLARCLPPPAL